MANDRILLGQKIDSFPQDLIEWGFIHHVLAGFPFSQQDTRTNGHDGQSGDWTGSYIGNQNKRITLVGNAWKRSNGVRFTYNEGFTTMSIDFRARISLVEIHGVTFVGTHESDSKITDAQRMYQFGGTDEHSTRQSDNPNGVFTSGFSAGKSSYNPFHMDYTAEDIANPGFKTYMFDVTGLDHGEEYDVVFIHDNDAYPGTNLPISTSPEALFQNLVIDNGSFGLFVSKPGTDVNTLDSRHNLIFDSTAAGLFQVVQTGQVVVEKAPSTTAPTETFIYTGIPIPHADNSSLFLSWNSLLDPATVNISTAFTREDTPVTTNCPWLNLGLMDIKNSYEVDIIPGHTLTSRLSANTDTSIATQDISFTNGSPNNDQLVSWLLYSEKGTA
jgi:hypothetical protein